MIIGVIIIIGGKWVTEKEISKVEKRGTTKGLFTWRWGTPGR